MARRKTNHDATATREEVQTQTGEVRSKRRSGSSRARAKGQQDQAAAPASPGTPDKADADGSRANVEQPTVASNGPVQRAEEMVNRVGHQLLRFLTLAQEEVEDMVAEAQRIRHGDHPGPTHSPEK